METKDDTLPEPMPASKLTVIYLNGVRNARSWNDESLRREVRRVFPKVECRAKCLQNGGIMLYSFKYDTDVRMVHTTDWSLKVDGELPFGGVREARKDTFLSRDTLTRTVRLRVHEDSRAQWVAEILSEDGFGDCVVEEIGEPRYGFRTLRVVAESQELARKMTTEGVRIGASLSVPEHWQYASGTKLCTSCWRHHDTRRPCTRAKVCGKCSKQHAGRCQEFLFKCPNCSCDHSVHSRRCSYRHQLYRRFAERTGLPLPKFVNSNNVDVPVSHVVQGRSFAYVAGQRQNGRGARPTSNNQHINPIRQEARHQNAVNPQGLSELPLKSGHLQPDQAANAVSQPRSVLPRAELEQIVSNAVETQLKPIFSILETLTVMLKQKISERVSVENSVEEPTLQSQIRNDENNKIHEASRVHQNGHLDVGGRTQPSRGRHNPQAQAAKGCQRRNAISISPSPVGRRQQKVASKAAQDFKRISALAEELAALKKAYEESPNNHV